MTRLIPAFAALMLSAAPVMADRVAVLVFDASGSMWNRVEGDLTRIEVARDVMGDYFGSRDSAVPLSVIAYGHNRRGDCRDIEVVTPMGQGDAGSLESRLRALMPRGMTPLTDSLAMARDQIPPSAEAADIILVTDGLENCEGDPCALAASLAAEGIDIRAHVVGFGLSAVEVEALSCITDQTGGMLFQTNSGAELANALQQVSAVVPEPEVLPEPTPPAAAFDIGEKAEAGFTYSIRWTGEAGQTDFLGFVPQGADGANSSASFGPINIGQDLNPRNPVSRTAPAEPGMYDLIIRSSAGLGVIARQPVEVVPPAMGFDPIGSVEPGTRVDFTFRAPSQLGERVVLAEIDQPVDDFRRIGWDYALAKNGLVTMRVPAEPGEYEIRYLNASAREIMFSRRFGVGIQFEDADLTTTDDLAAQAATARGAPTQDDIAAVPATFRLPPDVPQSDVMWDAVPLDADMSPEAWAPMDTGPVITGTFEPGNWRVTAYAPGEVTLSADVAIFPGQANDFTVQINASEEEDHGALGLEGPWRALAVPPRDAPAGSPADPITLVDVTLRTNTAATGYEGQFLASPGWLGAAFPEGPLDSVREEEGYVFITFALPTVEPDPFVLSLAPFEDGFSGTLAAGANSIPVIFWPGAMPLPPMDDLQDQLYGPTPEDHGSLQPETVFACAESVCSWTDPASGVTVPLPQGWSVTAPEFQTASATPTEMDIPSMSLFGPEGQELRLNPRMWIDSDGVCHDTPDLGRLCHFKDADIVAQMTAMMIAPMMERGQPVAGAQTRPVLVSLAGVPRDATYDLEITLVTGKDPAYETTQRVLFETAQAEHVLGVGNVYDIWAVSGTRQYRNRNVTVTPGNMAQSVTLAPVYLSDEVTLTLPDTPIVAGSGGYFPVTLTAPDGFQGAIAVHDADDRDGPALFSVSGAQMLGGQDQVLPVPDQPGVYEVRFLDLNGEMFGGTEFEAVASDAGATEITVTPTGRTQFETGCFISADLTGPEGGSYRMIAPVTATANGRDLHSIVDAEAPLVLEIQSFGSTGQSTADLMLMARCDSITLDFAAPQCRYFEGDGNVTRDCPAPVVFAPMQLADGGGFMADAIVQGAAAAAQSPTETPTDPSFIEITPEGMSTDQLLDLLLAPANTE